jgi:predicted amidohydrolase
MLIALAQYNYHIGNFENNIRKICWALRKQSKQMPTL